MGTWMAQHENQFARRSLPLRFPSREDRCYSCEHSRRQEEEHARAVSPFRMCWVERLLGHNCSCSRGGTVFSFPNNYTTEGYTEEWPRAPNGFFWSRCNQDCSYRLHGGHK
ncbi:unnamed protein product, partial [Hapterophycus canaliculatus]